MNDMSIFSCNITYKKIKGDSEKSTYNNLVAHGFIDESYKILNDDFYKANNELNLLASNKLGKDVKLYQVENKIAVPNIEVFKEIDKINTSKNNIVNKKGIDFVYSQNPELETIGSKEQYSEYLKTIFPDSKVKDIVYHGTDKKFDKFDKLKIGSRTDLGEFGQGFYFTPKMSPYYKEAYGEGILVLLNSKNILKGGDELVEKLFGKGLESIQKEFGKVDTTQRLKEDGTTFEYVVFEPEQIHILGSKQDIEGFKKFVKKEENLPVDSSNYNFNLPCITNK